MANKITGRIIVLTPIETLTARSGNSYQKREVVIERTVFDRNTGQPATDPDDTPIFRVFGTQATELGDMAVGDMVTVHYELEGRSYLKDGVKNYFTDVRVFRIEPAQRQTATASAEQPATQQAVEPAKMRQPTAFGQASAHNGIASPAPLEDELPF